MLSATRPVRRVATTLISSGLMVLLAASTVLAGTPVTNGYRDHLYGGGASRPSGDKPQSKLWYTDEGGGTVQWWAGMFYTTTNQFRIWRLSADKTTWTVTPTILDARDDSHADHLWDEATNTLYVISTAPVPATIPTAPPSTGDDIRIFKYSYSPGTNAYTLVAGFPHAIPGTGSVPNVSKGGAATVTIALDSTGDLWASWPKEGQVLYSRSEDGGVTWAAGVQIPVQGDAGGTINEGTSQASRDVVGTIAFGAGTANKIGILWSDHDSLPSSAENGYYFGSIDAGADPLTAGNWSLQKLPGIAGAGGEQADNHLNIKTTSDGRVFMVGKTGSDTAQCATNKQRALIPFYSRTAGGAWSVNLAGTVGDCHTRPQVVISEQQDVAYLFLTSPNGGGTIYRKAAPLTGSEAFKFRGPTDQTVQHGVPFIRSASETLIDDASTTKQVVTDATGIAVIANNLISSQSPGNAKYYLHNFMDIGGADSTAPAGTVTINGGAANTSNQTVSVAVPATDAGSGMSLVRISNSADMSNATTTTYTSPIAWDVTAGFGTKTVYVEWRDGAGNWSTTASDTIELTDDITPPNAPTAVTHRIFGSGRFGIPVRVEWPAASDNVGGSGIASYRVQRSVNGGPMTDFSNVIASATPGLSLDLPNSAVTYRFCVYSKDARGNESTTARCSATFKTVSVSESSAAMKFTGTWSLSSSSVYVGGKAKVSSTKNASAAVSFRGNHVGWYARLGPTYGQAKVYIDGVFNKTVNLFSSTVVDRKLVFTKSWSAVGNHSIKIVVYGTSGHPKVVVDQVFYLQ